MQSQSENSVKIFNEGAYLVLDLLNGGKILKLTLSKFGSPDNLVDVIKADPKDGN
jgi:hypothetical protein